MECKVRTFTESEVEAIVKIAAETAAQTALTEFNRRNEDMLAKKNERAYKNTTTLLEGYTAMKAHCKSAIAKAEDTLATYKQYCMRFLIAEGYYRLKPFSLVSDVLS